MKVERTPPSKRSTDRPSQSQVPHHFLLLNANGLSLAFVAAVNVWLDEGGVGAESTTGQFSSGLKCLG